MIPFILTPSTPAYTYPTTNRRSTHMPGIQEYMLQKGQAQNQHWMMLLINLLPKIIMLLYRIIRNAIQHGWIFPTLGLAIAGVIHSRFPNLHVAWIVIIYIALVSAGIPLMIWKLNWNKRKGKVASTIINPEVPDELSE